MTKKETKKIMDLRNSLNFYEERRDEEKVNEIRKELLKLNGDNDLEELNSLF